MIEYLIIGGGILFGLLGFIIGTILVARSYKKSPSLTHYKRIVDILTLRKLWKRKVIPEDITNTKKDHIKHYEDMRDKLTIRKKTEIPEENSGGGLGLISQLIGGFIVILIGVSLLPSIANQVQIASQTSSNVSSSSSEMTSTILKTVPFFFGIAILGTVIAVIFGALRNSGMV